VRVWDISASLDTSLDGGRELAVLRGHEDWVKAVAVTPDGRQAVSASHDGTLRVWDLACAEGTGQEVAELRGHEDWVNAVAVTPDGRRVVSASDDLTVRVWDISASLDTSLDGGRELAVLRGHASRVNAVAVTPDGRQAVSASSDRTMRVWDSDTGEELAVVALDGGLETVAVASDGVTVVTGDGAGNVYCLRYVEPPDPE